MYGPSAWVTNYVGDTASRIEGELGGELVIRIIREKKDVNHFIDNDNIRLTMSDEKTVSYVFPAKALCITVNLGYRPFSLAEEAHNSLTSSIRTMASRAYGD